MNPQIETLELRSLEDRLVDFLEHAQNYSSSLPPKQRKQEKQAAINSFLSVYSDYLSILKQRMSGNRNAYFNTAEEFSELHALARTFFGPFRKEVDYRTSYEEMEVLVLKVIYKQGRIS